MARKFMMVGNWKMNQGLQEIEAFFATINSRQNDLCKNAWIAPQMIHLSTCLNLAKAGAIKVGAQNCGAQNDGAFTGETSPLALKDLGATFTLIGHSERRALFNESDELLAQKTKLALENNLTVIFCVGETLSEREAGQTLAVVLGQIKAGLAGIPAVYHRNLVIAYEPVWAIGTGKVATPEQAQEVHAAIRQYLSEMNLPQDMSLLYGGSVKPDNIESLLACADIDGGLVGGASLKANDFVALCHAVKALE